MSEMRDELYAIADQVDAAGQAVRGAETDLDNSYAVLSGAVAGVQADYGAIKDKQSKLDAVSVGVESYADQLDKMTSGLQKLDDHLNEAGAPIARTLSAKDATLSGLSEVSNHNQSALGQLAKAEEDAESANGNTQRVLATSVDDNRINLMAGTQIFNRNITEFKQSLSALINQPGDSSLQRFAAAFEAVRVANGAISEKHAALAGLIARAQSLKDDLGEFLVGLPGLADVVDEAQTAIAAAIIAAGQEAVTLYHLNEGVTEIGEQAPQLAGGLRREGDRF